MNLLLLEAAAIAADGTAVVTGRRAEHIATVLRAQPGQRLCAGIVDGPLGHAEVLEVGRDRVRVRVDCAAPAPTGDDVLVLAVPRPKVLLRLLEAAAALGIGRIVLVRTWRVDKSHFDSRAMDPAVQREHLCLGLEQAQRTRLPRLSVFPLFKPFVEDVLPTLALPAHRFCAHPDAALPTHSLQLSRGAAFALAIGPEGGFLPYEVDRLAHAGFLPVRLSFQPLRTEAAFSALHAQLDLLRTRQ